MSEQADTVETQEAPAIEEQQENNSLLPQEVELGENEYLLQDGVKGVGEPPEWYKASKYKSVADQAKAYSELEKKLGAFTGAPEEYKVDEEFSYLSDDPMYQEFKEFAKESGMSQEAHDKLVSTFLAKEQIEAEEYQKQQLEALGPKAQQRITNVDNFLKGNLDADTYQNVAQAVNSAASVELVETLVKALRPAKLPVDGGENPTGITEEEILKLQTAVDDHGRRRMEDPQYAAMVRQKAEAFYGKE